MRKKPIISYPSPVLPHEDGVLAENEAISSKDFNDDSVNDKTHFYTSEYSNAVRDGVTKMGIKSTLHRSNALASSSYISGSESESSSVSNHSTPNSSPIAKKSNLNNSPRLYRSVLLKNISSSQESVESNGSSCKINSPQSSPQRRPGDSPFTTAPLMGTKALLASPKSFAVTIGFQPQVESSSKSNRTMSVGENLHHMSSCRPITPCVESHISGGNLTKRSSSMEILVYGKIREHNPSRKRSSGGCSREGSFKLHREISVETLMEIPETTSTIEERGYENYQEYLQRIKQNEDSKQNSTWSLCENEDSLSESVPVDKSSPYFCHTPHTPIQKKFSLPHDMHLKGPDEGSFSNPNLSRVGTSLSRGMPMSSSFTSSPFKRPHSSISTGVSPNKRGYANQGRNNETSPGCDDSSPASPLFEEEEDFEILKNESSFNNSPPNVLIYTANNEQYYESVKNTFLNVFSDDRYAIYHLTDEIAFKSPWKLNTKLLVVCGDVATHVSTVFIRFLLSGGKVFSVCSDFLNVAVPLFGKLYIQIALLRFQEAAVVSMSYNKWKNVQLLHHQHCFHSSPKHKNSKALEKKSNTGSAVSVEPTFVEITDEYGVRHRLDLKVLAKDDTWGAPSLLVANVSGKSGKALFSQVHLEQDPSKCITCELKGEQLKKSNESRLEILRHLLSTYMDIEIDSEAKERSQMNLPDYTPAYLLGRHELKQKFVEEMSKESKDGVLVRHSLSISFHNKEAQSSIPSRSFLPILLTGYTKEFSTELNTSFIGRLVVFCEVLSSTMNVVLGKSPLEDGIAVIAIRQREGRGRYGNMWLSPLGCTMFSLQLHFSVSSNMGQCLPFLQHLMSLAMVTAVTGIPGYKDIPLRLKWPNDIYLNSNTKIGGVIVEASIQGGRVIANLGCATKSKLAELTYEVLCARIFNQAEYFIKRFQENGTDDIIKEYYNYWLHGNAQVTVQNELGKSQTATITGIDQFGYLKASLKTGEDILLHPDGNSFNMMEGFIYHKKTKS
ncbi:Biotin--protein ligase [Armadillidium vulgare]|nr:Biotin--protein ligase [Armadillidium vulgare]